MNAGDVGADTTVYEGCNFSYATNGLLVANQGAVNHYLHGCGLDTLTNGAWFRQGGNLEWDGCKARSVRAVLKIGTSAVGYAPSMGGGGSANSAFLLRNVRTDPGGGPNVTVVDSAYAAPGTNVTVEGWDDTASNSAAGISFVQYALQPTGGTAVTNPSVTLTVTAGNTLVAFGGVRSTTPPSQTAISDNQGNTWVYVQGSGIAAFSNAAGAAWYCASAAGGSTTVTFNSGGINANLVVHEYSGVDAAFPLDTFAAANGNNLNPAANVATSAAGDMVVGYTTQGSGNVTYQAGTGLTLRANNGGGVTVQACASEDQLASTPGTYSAYFNFSTGGPVPWVAISLALKPSGPAVVLGAGSGVHVRDSLVNRPILAEEGIGNPPTSLLPATLRLENLIVPEGQIGASLCRSLTTRTKVDNVAERTATYNVVRPDVSTIVGRPRYSPLNWLILQQLPKFFYDLGDQGQVAPNQGWNLSLGASAPRTDGIYGGTYAQNVQGLVLSDGVGGFNTVNTGTAGTGTMNLAYGNVGLGQVSGRALAFPTFNGRSVF